MTRHIETSPEQTEGGDITISGRIPVKGITSQRIIETVRATLGGRPLRALNIAFVDDRIMASINRRYLNKAETTDVMSFDLRDDEDDEAVDGEIVVSGCMACVQARDLGVDADQELLRYVIHGVLHLIGYDDAEVADRRRMRAAEDRVLAGLDLGQK